MWYRAPVPSVKRRASHSRSPLLGFSLVQGLVSCLVIKALDVLRIVLSRDWPILYLWRGGSNLESTSAKPKSRTQGRATASNVGKQIVRGTNHNSLNCMNISVKYSLFSHSRPTATTQHYQPSPQQGYPPLRFLQNTPQPCASTLTPYFP